MTAEVAGHTVELTPEGALLHDETLYVADVHLGKGAAFRALGLPVPSGSTAATLRRLDRLLQTVRPRRLAILGDFWHARASRTAEHVEALRALRERHAHVGWTLVEGNHDRRAGPMLASLGIEEVSAPHRLGAFVGAHHPEPSELGYVLAGHIHPAVRIAGRARAALRLPCFWFGPEVGVLPAFGDFTGTAVVSPAPGDRVFAIAEGRVIALTAGPRS